MGLPPHSVGYKQRKNKASTFSILLFCLQRVFFLGSSEGKGRLSTAHAAFLLVGLVYLLLGAILSAVLCFLIYPVLSIVLWARGLFTVLRYIEQSRSKSTPWERRQLDLDEQEEWSLARAHAIVRNRRYSTANSSETEFNVDALLKTTTGMTMEDLGQSMRNFKSTRKQRALAASLDVALSQFPTEDRVSMCLWEYCIPRVCFFAQILTFGIFFRRSTCQVPDIE